MGKPIVDIVVRCLIVIIMSFMCIYSLFNDELACTYIYIIFKNVIFYVWLCP